MNKTLSVIALGTAFAVGGAWMLTRPAAPAFDLPPGAARAETAAVDPASDPAADPAAITEMALGAEDAPVTVIEYASYTCPHCASFHANQFQQLRDNYIDTGKIRFIYREVYFDRFGLWASMVARCGGEMRFFGISDMLYDQQQEWIAGGDATAISENLRRIGLTAGIDRAQLDACLSDAAMAQTLVAWFEENAAEDEITSTPSFVIDGQKYSNMSYTDFAAILDERLAQ